MSTKAQLSITFASLFGAIVIALAVSFYLAEKNDAYQRLDAALQVATSATAMSAEHELSEHSTKAAGERDLQSVLDESKSSALNDTEILVCEGRRDAAYKPGLGPEIDLCEMPSDLLKNRSNTDGLRLATIGLIAPKFKASYVVYAVKPIAPVLERLHIVRLRLFILVPLGLMVASLAGYFLASRSLHPLHELTQTIDAVTSSDLSARVPMKRKSGEIGTLVERFNSLLARLEQAFNVQRRFMADASHQIRTPITVALAAAQVISRDSNSDLQDCKESLEVIERQMLQLRRIVEDMFFLSQADTASLKIARGEIYLDDAISDAVRSAMALAGAKKQTLKVSALPEAKCLGDVDLLTQAIVILLHNAVKYTPPQGVVEVALFERTRYWICSVTDNGPGISKSAQSRIFERFFRENRPGSDAGGAGLGLAIAKSIVENHSGTIALLASDPGQTTFEIAIPVAKEAVIPDEVQANSLAVRI
jgi:signal transduction histidine kinase